MTASTSHPVRFWLKAPVSANMPSIFVTLEVFHPLMSWLNSGVPMNMKLMFSTLEVSNEPISWVKLEKANIPNMSVADEVSQVSGFAAVPGSSPLLNVCEQRERKGFRVRKCARRNGRGRKMPTYCSCKSPSEGFNVARVPARQILVENLVQEEHASHVLDAGGDPVIKGFVECFGCQKDVGHVGHAARIPAVDRLIEHQSSAKHSVHTLHTGHCPVF